MHATATGVETYLQEPGGFRLRGVVGALVVAAHLGLIVWVMLPGSPPAPQGVESMQVVFIPPPEQKETPPPPAPKLEQPPILASKRVVESAPAAPVIPPEPAPEAPAAEPVQESTPPSPPMPPAPVAAAPSEKLAYSYAPKPRYPEHLRRAGVEGKCFLRIQVSPAGRVIQVELVTSSGYPEMDAAAMQSVRDWKFSSFSGSSPKSATLPIVFKLDKRA